MISILYLVHKIKYFKKFNKHLDIYNNLHAAPR